MQVSNGPMVTPAPRRMRWFGGMIWFLTQLPCAASRFGIAGGERAELGPIDDNTLQIKYLSPAPLTAKRLAMWVNGDIGPRWIAPAHYLKQFHPTYNPEQLNFEAFNRKCSSSTNPEMPSLNPGRLPPSRQMSLVPGSETLIIAPLTHWATSFPVSMD